MSLDPDGIDTVTFDSYSTVVDVDTVEAALAERVPNPDAVARLWRRRSLEYATASNALDAYAPFHELLADALDYALAAHGIDLPDAERTAVLDAYDDLDAFGDVVDGMARLADAGYDLYVVSNGSPPMLETMVAGAGVGESLADTISADEVATYKPEPAIYRHAAARTGTPIDRIVHASAGWFDVAGARHAGASGAWINRAGDPPERFGGEPDLVAETFHDLADALDAPR